MIIDAIGAIESSYSADVAIVGAGAAGITVADELDRAGHSVILIESGGQQISRSAQSLNRAAALGLRSFSAAASRFRCFGGSTARWGGQCRPLDAIDFDANHNQSETGWPFSLAELEPYYQRAAEICNLPRSFSDTPWLHAHDDCGLDKITYQFAYPRNFGEIYRTTFRDSSNIRVLLNATIAGIKLDKNGNRVSHLCARAKNGNETRIRANSIVLAGGGIENARLLLASNDIARNGIGNSNDLVGRYFNDHPYAFIGELRTTDAEADTIANQFTLRDYDRVGLDQESLLALTLNDAKVMSGALNKCALYFVRRAYYKSTADYYSRAGVSLNYVVDLLRRSESLDRPLMPEILEIAKGMGSILTTAARAVEHVIRPTRTFSARVVMTARPHADSRVTLGKQRDRFGVPLPRVNWKLHQADRDGLIALMAAAKEYFASHKLGNLIEIPWDERSGWPRGMTGGKHHMGTTRMHKNPDMGVVDADSRVHEVDNLFVAGSSVFPTGGYANPTLTIVALAVRLADRLKEI